jgi:ribonuclease P protein component
MEKKTFKKEERLCSKSLIDKLFHSGSSFIVYPFRMVYKLDTDISITNRGVQVIISVAKKRFRRAHDRNRIKRLMREVYRLEKGTLLYPYIKSNDLTLLLAIQYVGKEELPFELLSSKMKKGIEQLVHELPE